MIVGGRKVYGYRRDSSRALDVPAGMSCVSSLPSKDFKICWLGFHCQDMNARGKKGALMWSLSCWGILGSAHGICLQSVPDSRCDTRGRQDRG